MAQSTFSQIVTNGLVFYYDMNNSSKSWRGEPTTNLSYNNGQGGSEYLAASYTWTNTGSWNLNSNETDVNNPIISNAASLPSNLRIISGVTTSVGSQHFGCAYTSISGSTTYTVSVWFRQNRAGCSAPDSRRHPWGPPSVSGLRRAGRACPKNRARGIRAAAGCSSAAR